MAAVAHNPAFAKKVGVSQKVGREFNDADKGTGILSGPIHKADGGQVSDLTLPDLVVPRKKPTGPARVAEFARKLGPKGGAEVRARIALGLLSQIYGIDGDGNARLAIRPGSMVGVMPGMVNDLLSIGTLAGDHAPEFSKRAAERSERLKDLLHTEMGVDEPHGFWENFDESLGIMGGQIPIGGLGTGERVASVLPKGAQRIAKSLPGKILLSPFEFFSPTIDATSPLNYLTGALFGGAMGALGGEEPRIQEAAPVVKKSKGGKVSDIKNLVRLAHKYADGGRVAGTARALKIIKEAISHLESGDPASAITLLRSSPEAMNEPGIADLVSRLTTPAGRKSGLESMRKAVEADTNKTVMPTMSRGGWVHEEPDGDEGIHGPALGGDGDGDEKMKMAKGGKVGKVTGVIDKLYQMASRDRMWPEADDPRLASIIKKNAHPDLVPEYHSRYQQFIKDFMEHEGMPGALEKYMSDLSPSMEGTDPQILAAAPRGAAQGAKAAKPANDTYFTAGGIWRKDGTPVTDPAEIEAVAKKFKLHGLKPNPTYADNPEVAFDLDLPNDRRFKKLRNLIDGEDGAIHLEDKDHMAYFTLPR